MINTVFISILIGWGPAYQLTIDSSILLCRHCVSHLGRLSCVVLMSFGHRLHSFDDKTSTTYKIFIWANLGLFLFIGVLFKSLIHIMHQIGTCVRRMEGTYGSTELLRMPSTSRRRFLKMDHSRTLFL